MNCEQARNWIWESVARQEPPPAVMTHLNGCADCADELRARAATARDLRAMRTELEDEPASDLDDRVLAAARASVRASSGDYPVSLSSLEPDAIPDDVADALAESIAEEYGEQFAALTTGRLRVDREMARAREMGLLDSSDEIPVAPAPPPAASWQPPRATPQWMAAAALLLGVSLAIGFVAGRASAPPRAPSLTIATASDGLILSRAHRQHQVGLSEGAVDQLQQGNTYLLAGPVGGPYEVMGVVGWDDLGSVPLPTTSRSELIVAVGPAGGFSKGIELAANDLTSSDVEILGRRALPTPGR